MNPLTVAPSSVSWRDNLPLRVPLGSTKRWRIPFRCFQRLYKKSPASPAESRTFRVHSRLNDGVVYAARALIGDNYCKLLQGPPLIYCKRRCVRCVPVVFGHREKGSSHRRLLQSNFVQQYTNGLTRVEYSSLTPNLQHVRPKSMLLKQYILQDSRSPCRSRYSMVVVSSSSVSCQQKTQMYQLGRAAHGFQPGAIKQTEWQKNGERINM